MNARTAVGTVADLHASAARMTGLDDFGTDDYADGLAVLLDSYSADEDLTPLGSKMSRVFLRGALAARLLSEAGWREYPEHASAGIDRPVFVTGLPRTGTTALHRLLTADPAHQGLELWLTQAPQPRPPRETWAADPVYAQLQAAYAQHHVEYPEFMGVHYIAADQVEECWQLLRQSMRSISFECLAHLPRYSSWLAAQDWTGAYRRHRRNLQLIGLRDAGRRWVLKNPSHLFALDELLAVYPDALVIQTHRPPRDAIASACSLAAHATDGWSRRFTSTVIGSDQLALWARGLDSFMAARHRHEAASQHGASQHGASQHGASHHGASHHGASHHGARFCDVRYAEFVADPIGTVERVYDAFGLTLSGIAADAMRAMQAGGADGAGSSTRGGSVPAHRYALADFGLTAEQVDERFAGYLAVTDPGGQPGS